MRNRTISLVLCVGLSSCSNEPSAPPAPTTSAPRAVTATRLADLGFVPYDVNTNDLVGPDSHNAQYGRAPELIASVYNNGLDIVAQESNVADGQRARAFYLRVNLSGSTATLGSAFELPSLGVLLGMVTGSDGSIYYATGTTEPLLSRTYPAPSTHRTNVIRVYKLDREGRVLFDVDLDMARAAFKSDAESIVHPSVAATGRLGITNGLLALVTGNNTAPDANGTRHQKALATYLDPATGAIKQTSGEWVSHSFDQRYVADGNDLIELHLGDAYPRAIVASRIAGMTGATAEKQVYKPKGNTGANNTFTRLGDLVKIGSGTHSGKYLLALTTERNTAIDKRVNAERELCLIRLVPTFWTSATPVDETFGTVSTVQSGGGSADNRALCVTNYATAEPGAHAERPKLLDLGNNNFVLLYEKWTISGTTQTFAGTYGMRVGPDGAVVQGPSRLFDSHLPRGDDAFVLNGEAGFATASSTTKQITLHFVSNSLQTRDVLVP